MSTEALLKPIPIKQMGKNVEELFSSGNRGKVIASFSRACYLVSEQNELFWMVDERSPMHRRCLQVPKISSDLKAGMEYEISDQRFMITPCIYYYICGVEVWTRREILENPIRLIALKSQVISFFEFLTAREKPAGWGSMIPDILKVSKLFTKPADCPPIDPFSQKAWQSICRILMVSPPDGFNSLVDELLPIVGLGSGLTPSGDDFLGGFFFILRILGEAYSFRSPISDWNYRLFLSSCVSQTNLISYTLLSDLVQGYAIQPLHEFTAAFLAGNTIEELFKHAEKITPIGHSTGWDLLTGFLVGMLYYFRLG